MFIVCLNYQIKYISCYPQLKEIKSTPIQSIFLFNLTNSSYQNIDQISFVLKIESSATINDCMLYNCNIVFTKVNPNELNLTITNFNKWEKITFKVQATNCKNEYFNLISNSTGIKIKLIGKNKVKLILIQLSKLLIFPFRKSIYPLLNKQTEKIEKRKKRTIKVTTIGTFFIIVNICFPGVLNIPKHYKNLFPKDNIEQNLDSDSLLVIGNQKPVQDQIIEIADIEK